MTVKKQSQKTEKKYTVAKQDDGSVQITFTITWKEIDQELNKAAAHLKENVTVKGFRKGKAPIAKVRTAANQAELTEHALQHILPKLFSDAVVAEKLQPITYPKFELIETAEGKDWQVRANTAEEPKFELGDYKKVTKDALAAKSITKELTREQKEQVAIEALLESVKFEPPAILVEDETNNRLAGLLERVEKLGLNLDSYLASVGKDAGQLRSEYNEQAKQTLKLEILLNAISEEEKVEVAEKEVDEFISAAQGDPNSAKNLDNPTQRRIIGSILRKRKTLDILSSQK